MKLLILLVSLTSICADHKNSSSCPLWHNRIPGSDSCECGDSIGGAVLCHEGHVYLRVDYAMVWDSQNNQTVVAASRYVYHNSSAISSHLRVYSLLSNDTTELQLNYLMCQKNYRKGFLCENCLPNYGPIPHSSKCYECGDPPLPSAIALYLAMQFLPIALLFLLITTFRINITAGPMLGYIFFCQAHILLARELGTSYKTILAQVGRLKTIFYLSFYLSVIWSLDFLQVLYNIYPFCISPNLRDLDILLLNFISVLFPLFLVALTYILIELHARDCKIVVCCWKPFHSCFARFRRNWSASDSIVHAFASLLLLSFANLNYNAFELLKSINIYNSTGDAVSKNVLFNRPSLHWYTHKNIYHCILVLLFLFFFGICPSLLLLLYPIQIMRVKLQRCFSQRLQITLNTFVETFHGPLKDGCNGTRDFRIIPGLIACLVLLLNTLGCLAHIGNYGNYLVLTFVVTFATISILTAYAHPFKSSITNLSVTFHFMWMAAIGALLVLWWQALNMDTRVLTKLLLIFVPVPHILMLIWVLYKIKTKLHSCQKMGRVFSFVMGWTMIGKQLRRMITSLLPDVLVDSQYHELT